MKKIKILHDPAGFTFQVDDMTFETDYRGLINFNEIETIKELLEYLGYEVESAYQYDCEACEDEGCEDCGY